MLRVKDIVGHLRASFKLNKIPEPEASAYFVLEKALRRPQKYLRNTPYKPISQYHFNIIQKAAIRRLKHEPIQYILGEWGFRDLTLKTRRPVLVPRPETEELVDIALKLYNIDIYYAITLDRFENHKGRFHFVDVGCGCGAISLALLKEKPGAYGVAIDLSLPALTLTVQNFWKVFGKETKLEGKLDVIQSSWKDFADKNVHKFDLIISNPPYIPTEEVAKLERQVREYEDLRALDGGQYGLDMIWELIRRASDEMKTGGYLVMEVGLGQPEYLEEYFRENGNLVHNLAFVAAKQDFTYRKRFVILQKKTSKKGKEKSTDESD